MIIERWLGGVLVFGIILFLPAGTLRYWEAWLFMGVLLIPVAVFGIYLLRHNPALLERRLKMREREPQQRKIIAASALALFAMFLLPGLDRRLGWSSVPIWLVLAANVLILVGYLLSVLAFQVNEYASRTIEVEQPQRVISTGPYAVIRHPLYLAGILIYGAAPLALGSYWALLPALLLPALLVARIRNEEQVLRRDLHGYTEYCSTVRYRLIPRIW